MFTIACVITAVIVSVWLTAIVRIAAKNFAVKGALKSSTYWQLRARRAEALLAEMAAPPSEDPPMAA